MAESKYLKNSVPNTRKINLTQIVDSVRRRDVTGGRKKGKPCGMYKNLWDKISFQLLNERSVDSNFNIIQYEKQSA